MNIRRSQLYLAHSCHPDPLGAEPEGVDDYAAELRSEDAAEYIATLLSSLRAIAIKAQFSVLSDLLSVAEEEAKLHCRV